MSNILIQGDTLKPIDFNDPRHEIDPDFCIRVLLECFDGERLLFKNPHYFIDYYKDLLNDDSD
jgi:hypothetical protein